MPISSYKKIVIKIGSNVIAGRSGKPDEELLANLVSQVSQLRQKGLEVVLVSSGAVASAREILPNLGKISPIARRQVLASVGQIRLMEQYRKLFDQHRLLCAQVLVTKEDFRDRAHFLNMKNCFHALIQQGVVPIVNENDVISVTELMFTDNDELAGLVASMLDADALLILTNVNGVYNGDPQSPDSQLIPRFTPDFQDFSKIIVTKKSEFGRGGMVTKCRNAQKVARLGISVHIASGSLPDVLLDLVGADPPGTHFLPVSQAPSTRKKWIAQSGSYTKGRVVVNEGAQQALLSGKVASLLPIGVVQLEGDFAKGDLIEIRSEAGEGLGLGLASYAATTALERIGKKNQPPIVHYDHLFLYDK